MTTAAVVGATTGLLTAWTWMLPLGSFQLLGAYGVGLLGGGGRDKFGGELRPPLAEQKGSVSASDCGLLAVRWGTATGQIDDGDWLAGRSACDHDDHDCGFAAGLHRLPADAPRGVTVGTRFPAGLGGWGLPAPLPKSRLRVGGPLMGNRAVECYSSTRINIMAEANSHDRKTLKFC
jgi:hypothetical protein